MAILMPNLTVEVYNADYRVLSRIPWQEAIRLILRGAVYVIDVHSPAVHIRSPSLVIELPMSVALREYVHIPYRRSTGSPVMGSFAATDVSVPTAAGTPTPWITSCRAAAAAGTPGSTWWLRANPATVSRVTGHRRRPGWP
jgi:hypothetical protein